MRILNNYRQYPWWCLLAVIVKEFIQMKRDRGTLAMIVAIPLMQVILFGYAINSNPKHLPTVVVSAEQNNFTRTFVSAMQNSTYFDVIGTANNSNNAAILLANNKAQFIVNFPPNFAHDLVRGLKPQILITADATDPSTTGNALSAIQLLSQHVFDRELQGALSHLIPQAPPATVVVHAKYNPEVITQYNIVPGLLGMVITMTMVMITSMAVTREREHGTMENLLATPLHPIDIILGKLIPYIIVGYIQSLLILFIGYLLFSIPLYGSLTLLLILMMPFIAANLAVGLLFSTVAKTQLQATQMTIFFFLPSILLSGFMFPFRGMPLWAQYIGETLPLTHFLRITRGILLKGNGLAEVWPDTWPILLFLALIVAFGIKRLRRTLD